MVKITHANGELALTPDHVLLVDGEWAAARTVKVGSSVSGSNVTAISQGFAGVVNPLTTNGRIIGAGPTGHPIVASTYPEWIAGYMLHENSGIYPLPLSAGNLLTFLFPISVQTYYDEVLEGAFEANQAHLSAIKLRLPRLRWSARSSFSWTSSARPALCSTQYQAASCLWRSLPWLWSLVLA